MKSEKSASAITLCISMGSICVSAMIYLTVLFLPKLPAASFKDVDLAAWVQAVGSIAAIFFSTSMVLVSHQLDRKRALDEERKRVSQALQSAKYLAERAADVLGDAISEFSEPNISGTGFFPMWIRALELPLRALDQLSPTNFGDPVQLRAFLNIRGNIEVTISHLQRGLATGKGPDYGYLRAEFRHGERLMRSCIKDLDKQLVASS